MKELNPVYYIEYTTKNDKNIYYKKVETDEPKEISYEKEMRNFSIIQMLDVSYGGEVYHIVTERGKEKYAFGKLQTLDDILSAMKNGEYFNIDEKTIISLKKWLKEPLWITPDKDVNMNDYENYIDVDDKEYQTAIIAKKEKIENQIEAQCRWYIEYKQSENLNLYYKPTFCNDKEFRFEEGMEQYRLVKVAEFEINGQNFKIIIDGEPWQEAIKENFDRTKEVYRAIDGAKVILYNEENIKKTDYFTGYTRIYPFNTEDSASVFKSHKESIEGKDVLTVTGSGDALLDLFLNGANKVTGFDCNGLAKYYAKLKFYAIKSGMSFEKYEEFFLGNQIGDYVLKRDIFNTFKEVIEDEDTITFWEKIYSYANDTELKIANNYENLLTYATVSYMMTSNNKTVGNPNSYFNKQNYDELQKILQTKTIDDIEFIDASLLELPELLQKAEKKYDYMYLSNIIDFTSLYIFKDKVGERLEVFKDFILKSLSRGLNINGIIDVGYLAGNWRNINADTPSLEEYQNIFGKIKGFYLEDIESTNGDTILTYESR